MAADGGGGGAAKKLARLEQKSRKRDERREAKREELARSALVTLQDLGYARTSLRDVAEQSGNSVGLIHYYFDDKEDLIAHCVRLYKRDFIAAVDAVVETGKHPDHTAEVFVDAVVETIRDQPSLHRL
ncbi:MAG: TetR/AcrR family transcriptional regulator, partial [Myxococcota bacterium]